MTATAQRAGQVLTWLLLVLAVATVAVLVVIPRLTGGAALTVLTGSMAPAHPAGSLVLVGPAPLEDIAAGDVITFATGPETFVTHRVVEVLDETPPRFVTRGDANDVDDLQPILAEQVRGIVRLGIPHVGRFTGILDGPMGWTLLAAPLLLLFIAGQVRVIVGEVRDGRRRGGSLEPPVRVADAHDGPPRAPIVAATTPAPATGDVPTTTESAP